jgi:excisionase family DNA binding protein
MTDVVTYQDAANILGCHVSNVPKLIRKGELTSTGKRGGSFNRDQVEALAARREAEGQERAKRPARKYQRLDYRPDQNHDWLSPRQVAELLGFTSQGVRHRIHRGKLPAVESGGRFWVRYDHLELVERARLAQRVRRP